MSKNTNKESTETKFSIHELREHCRTLFNVKPEVFDGAFFNSKITEVSKKEAGDKIKDFLNRKVKKEVKK
ncbi:hypothetical protein ACQKCU_23845 [Heyndrickxia sporothermodurans]